MCDCLDTLFMISNNYDQGLLRMKNHADVQVIFVSSN